MKIPRETQKEKLRKSSCNKIKLNSVKDRQLHALHNRFGEQQDERPQ